jgi:hypothetical protein
MNSHRTKKEFLAGVILSFWMLTSLSFRSIESEIENVAFTDVIVDYKFDQSLVIEGKINRPSTLQDIKDVYIVLQPESSPSITEKLSLVQPDRISFEHDLYQNPWYPFERIEFSCAVPGWK